MSLGTSLNIEESVFGCFLLASPNNKIKPYIFFKFVYDVQIQWDTCQKFKCVLEL